MIATICPGSIALAAGAVTCASTLPMATAMPGRSPVQRAASSVRPPARSPNGDRVRASLVLANPAKAGLSAARNSADGYRPSW